MSLSVKVGILFLVILGISVYFSDAYLIQNEKDTLSSLTDSRGKSMAHMISMGCIELMLTENYPELNAYITNLVSGEDDVVSIQILHQDRLVHEFLKTGYSPDELILFNADVLLPMDAGEKPVKLGTVRLALSTRKNQAIISARRRELLFISCSMFLGLFLVLILAMRKLIFKRLSMLAEFALHIGRGDHSSHVKDASPDEIGCLARAMSTMSAQLVASNDKTVKAMDEAMASSKAKGNFLACMSHEIRTPLNAVIGFSQVLLQTTSLDVLQKEYLSRINHAGRHLLSIINDILDFSKIEAGKLDILSVLFNVQETVDSVMKTLNLKARERHNTLTLRVDSGIPGKLWGDPDRLRQVLINLLGNAIKFTEQGRIRLSVSMKKKLAHPPVATIRFCIKDTGPGISKEGLKKIFNSFTQIDDHLNRQYGGTGLGTTISKQLVEMMNGKIWVKSKLGKGSKFYFEIPYLYGDSHKIPNKMDNAALTVEAS